MADVLSQSEIDALLSALSSGELEPNEVHSSDEVSKVKIYDFKSPQKFSKDHIRSLEVINDKYARLISNYLTANIRVNAKVKLETVEQIAYEEFIHSVPNPTVLMIFRMMPFPGSIIMEINPTLSYKIIDILLGGDGNKVFINKEFSEIDKNIIRQIGLGMISNIKSAWEDVIEINTEFEMMETNTTINQTIGPKDPVALLTFSVEIGVGISYMHICLPYLSIEKYLDKLVRKYRLNGSEDNTDVKSHDHILNEIQDVGIEISAELGKAEIIVDDFLQLTKGDVITLDSRFDDPVKVYIENDLCYYAEPGIVGRKKGISILDVAGKDVEIDE